MSNPCRRALPAVGSYRPPNVRPTVDLPQPVSPTRPRVSPGMMVNDTASTARTVLSGRPFQAREMIKCFYRLRTSTNGRLMAHHGQRAPRTGCMANPDDLASSGSVDFPTVKTAAVHQGRSAWRNDSAVKKRSHLAGPTDRVDVRRWQVVACPENRDARRDSSGNICPGGRQPSAARSTRERN